LSEQNQVGPWDAAEFLENQADIDAYLEAAFDTGDPKQITKALGNAARAQGMRAVASKTGLAREHLYTSFSENGNPTLQTLTAMMDSLGYQLAVVPKSRNQRAAL
jgi:probable addiction module antidote protein